MGRLDGKVAVITGGAGVIGKAACKLFTEEGAKVLLVDTDAQQLDAIVRSAGNGNVSTFVADVTQPEQVQAYVNAAVERYGGIDVFLNNAGIEGVVLPVTEYPIDVFDKVMAVNVRGVFLGLKYVIPVMAAKMQGSIVITSSVAGVNGAGAVSAYITSKHALIGLMRTTAIECAPLNIRVNTINPSPVESRMMRSLESGADELLKIMMPDVVMPSAKEQTTLGIPMGRYAMPEEVAKVMLFLASDDSSFCTGGVYMVDGGNTCHI